MELAQQASPLDAARKGLNAQVLRNEQLKLRLIKLLRERFGASLEKLRSAIEQLELVLGDREEQISETRPTEPEPPATPVASEPTPPEAGTQTTARRHCRAISWNTPLPARIAVR